MDIKDIIDNKIIAIMRGVSGLKLLRASEAIMDGGIKLVEVAFSNNDKNTKEDIVTLKQYVCGKMLVGAGTVTTLERAKLAVEAGADFIMAPNFDKDIVRFAKSKGVFMISGAVTPTEIVNAVHAGADAIKIFPASVYGVEYIKALKAPFADITFIAASGVNKDNIKEYISAGYSGVGISHAFSDIAVMEKGDYEALTLRAKELVDATK